MADDLYTELLGIPPGPRPPNHYAILGLPLFEPDPNVVHEAVLRQTAELKRYALHRDPDRIRRVQEMLNEVNGAGVILQDPKTKGPYDEELAQKLGIGPPVPEATVVEESPPPAIPTLTPVAPPVPPPPRAAAAAPVARQEAAPPARQPFLAVLRDYAVDILVLYWGWGLLALALVLAIGLPIVLWPSSPEAQAPPKPTTATRAEPKKRAEPVWPFDAAEARRWQADVANELGTGVEQQVTLGDGVTLHLVLIPAGRFDIGSPAAEPDRDDSEGQKPVAIARPFWLGKYEVTQRQREAIMGTSDAKVAGPDHPVERVSWDDCRALLARLNERVPGGGFRLPMEAEWEWACRAGTASRFCFGDSDAGLGDYAWHSANSAWFPHPVGERRANAWGLHDMHGNVWEWCASPFSTRYDGSESQGEQAPSGLRILRGGSWFNNPWDCRSAERSVRVAGFRGDNVGFRIASSARASAAPRPTKAARPASPPKKPVEPPAPKAAVEVYTLWPFHAAEAKRRQEATAKALGVKMEEAVDLGGGVSLDLVIVPAGQFTIGSPAGEKDRDSDEDQRTVTIGKPFWMGKCEVTQEQWQALMGNNPARFTGTKNPVEQVSWDDCRGFVTRLNEKVPRGGFRLPTEAEWEWACRAGAATQFCFGDSDAGLGDYAWYTDNSRARTHPVGEKKPNAWGLYDMHGSVWEWCASPYADSYDGSESKGEDASARLRVLRGGSWANYPWSCRSANRLGLDPVTRYVNNGFRVVCSARTF